MLALLLLLPFFYSCLCFIGSGANKDDASAPALVETRKDVDIIVERGEALAYEGKLNDSRAFIDQALAIDPKNAHAYFAKAYNDYKFGNADLALSDYDKSIAYGSSNYCVFFQRGCLRSELGFKAMALEDFDKAMALSPNNLDVLFNRGKCYYELRQYKKSIADLTKAIGIAPQYAELYCSRAHALYGDRQPKAALADANRCLRLDPHHSGGFLVQSWVYEDAGRNDLALARLKTLLAFNPNDREARAEVGRLTRQKRKIN